MADTAEKQDVGDEAPAFDSWRKPDNMSLAGWIENSRIARFESRTYDWDALKFQADYDPKYSRSPDALHRARRGRRKIGRQCHPVGKFHLFNHGIARRLRRTKPCP